MKENRFCVIIQKRLALRWNPIYRVNTHDDFVIRFAQFNHLHIMNCHQEMK